MPKMSRAVENPHLKTFDSHSNSHVSTDSKDCFQDVGILLPPPREYYCVSFESKDFLEPESKTSGDLNVSLQHEIPLAQSLPPPKTKDKHPDSSNEDRCALDDEVPFFMFRPIREPVCEVPSPPPADAWFQSKDTHKVVYPDFKNDCSSLDDEVAFFISPCDVPLPPRPPTAELGHCRKHRYSSVSSVDDEYIPRSPSPPPAENKYVFFPYPDDKRSDLMPLSLPEYIPLSPSPPPVGDSSNYRKHLNSAFTERPHSVTAHEVSPHPPDEIPHLPEKRYFHLSTVAFPCFDD